MKTETLSWGVRTQLLCLSRSQNPIQAVVITKQVTRSMGHR